MDIGVWMSRDTLEDKLALRGDKNPEGAWNLTRWPSGFVEGEENRLFVASEGAWRGYFQLADGALLNRADPTAGFTLLFVTRTWNPIPPEPRTRFRGFTYKVPAVLQAVPGEQGPAERTTPPKSKSIG